VVKRVVSGMRPTGLLHIGHLKGVLETWLELQDEYETFYFVADWHALFGKYDRAWEVAEHTLDLIAIWLAVGIDPEKSVVFVQSTIPQHLELAIIFASLTPVGWLERNPTLKEMVRADDPTVSYGLLGYPVLQAADILVYKGELVPVGKDQIPHLELSRDIAGRFNRFYGDIFPMPQPILREYAAVPGTDGYRMSKSRGNYIAITDSPEEIKQKVRKMVTDPQKVRKGDPGRPEVCSVFALHKVFSTEEELQEIEKECRAGKLGCVACKMRLAEKINAEVAPIREKFFEIRGDKELLKDVILSGKEKAEKEAEKTMDEVREAMKWGVDKI